MLNHVITLYSAGKPFLTVYNTLTRSWKVRRANAATGDTQDQPLILPLPSGHQEGRGFLSHRLPPQLHFPRVINKNGLKFPKL